MTGSDAAATWRSPILRLWAVATVMVLEAAMAPQRPWGSNTPFFLGFAVLCAMAAWRATPRVPPVRSWPAIAGVAGVILATSHILMRLL